MKCAACKIDSPTEEWIHIQTGQPSAFGPLVLPTSAPKLFACPWCGTTKIDIRIIRKLGPEEAEGGGVEAQVSAAHEVEPKPGKSNSGDSS